MLVADHYVLDDKLSTFDERVLLAVKDLSSRCKRRRDDIWMPIEHITYSRRAWCIVSIIIIIMMMIKLCMLSFPRERTYRLHMPA
jgi:hypothetical protein